MKVKLLDWKWLPKYGSISSCNYDSKWKFSFVSVIKTINIQFNNQAEPDRHYCSCLRNDDKVCKYKDVLQIIKYKT